MRDLLSGERSIVPRIPPVMVRFFCPACWQAFDGDFDRCPACGANRAEVWDSLDMTEKLIRALGHRDSEVSLRAAWLLGRRKDRRAVRPLMALVERPGDYYLRREAVRALEEIGGAEAIAFVKTLADHPVKMIRDEARRIVGGAPRQ